MTAVSILPSFPIFTDIDGQPLEDGYIWIGVVNLQPIGNPVAVYWDAGLTIPAPLPIRTRGGFPVNSGTPANLYVGSDYSIQVQDKNGSVIYTSLSANQRYGDLITTTVSDIPALRAETWILGRPALITLINNYVVGDGGGAFRWDATSTATDNGGTIIKEAAVAVGRWIREGNDILASYFGAHPSASGATNRDAIQTAINYCASLGGGLININIPGYYNIARRTTAPTDRALNVPKGVNIQGLGTGAPQDAGVALVTLQPSEDMTVFIGGDTIATQTCTISNASPAVVSATAHGKLAGDVVYFATTGALPSPLIPMFPYYVLAAGLTVDTFRIGLTGSTPAINTTTAGSGVHTLISASSLTHSFGMSNINIYGGTVAAVQVLIAESTVGAEWDNVLVEPGAPALQRHGWLHAANSLAAWLNQYTRLQVGGFTAGVGAAHYGSDSSYSQCLFSGSGVNFRFSEGSITIDGGQCENGNNGGGIGTGRGIEIVPSNTGRNVTISLRSRFVANLGDVYIYDSPTGLGFNGRLLIDSVHHDCRATNISIGSNFNNVSIGGTFNEQNPPGMAHITWRGPSLGNQIIANFDEGEATRFSGLPPDAQVLAAGEDGQTNRLDGLQIAPATQAVQARQVRLETLGSDTILGQANVAARFGLARNSATFDAALLAGSLNGNGPFLSAVDGETTTATSFELNFRGAAAISMTTGAVSVNNILRPSTDNTRTLGSPSNRWTIVYATTGTINTSDGQEKTDIRSLTQKERAVAAAIKIKIGIFQWHDAIELKGIDGARLHVGVIAQDVQEAFEAEGLDPWRYAMLCADDILDEDGEPLRRLGVRYDQLNMFLHLAGSV